MNDPLDDYIIPAVYKGREGNGISEKEINLHLRKEISELKERINELQACLDSHRIDKLEERVKAIEHVIYRPRRRRDEVENFDGVAKALEDSVDAVDNRDNPKE